MAWLGLDEPRLRVELKASSIAYLFQGGRAWNAFTSPQLAEFILRTRYVQHDRDTLLKVYSDIVLKTADSANDDRSGFEARENLKELMKFRFLTKLFGDDAEARALIGAVYKRLSSANRIRNNPQFWLQFAMSRMEVNDLVTAETYLKTALGLAESRGKDYSPFQILDQRARLYLRKNTGGASFSRSEIITAINDLDGLFSHRDFEAIYPFRAMPLVYEFLEKHIDNVTGELKLNMTGLLTRMDTYFRDVGKLPKAQKGETKVLVDALRRALLILNNS